MRKIEFRAWLKHEKKMIDVKAIDWNQDGNVISVKCPQGKTYSGDNIELMQNTGLKDNNYDEIYEGDIVEIITEVEEYGIVKFLDGAFYVEADGFRLNFYDNIRGGDVLVIGNIYENKELLERI